MDIFFLTVLFDFYQLCSFSLLFLTVNIDFDGKLERTQPGTLQRDNMIKMIILENRFNTFCVIHKCVYTTVITSISIVTTYNTQNTHIHTHLEPQHMKVNIIRNTHRQSTYLIQYMYVWCVTINKSEAAGLNTSCRMNRTHPNQSKYQNACNIHQLNCVTTLNTSNIHIEQ